MGLPCYIIVINNEEIDYKALSSCKGHLVVCFKLNAQKIAPRFSTRHAKPRSSANSSLTDAKKWAAIVVEFVLYGSAVRSLIRICESERTEEVGFPLPGAFRDRLEKSHSHFRTAGCIPSNLITLGTSPKHPCCT